MITFEQDLQEPYREIVCTSCGEVVMKGHFHIGVLDDVHIECKECQTNKEKQDVRRRS